LAEVLKTDKIDLKPPIMRMGEQTSLRITDEIISSLRQSSRENILDPINVLLTEQINGRINKHITVNGTRIVFETIIGNSGNAEDALHDLITGSPAVLKAIVKDVSGFISMKNIRSTLEGTASDFIKNINMSEVGHDLRKTGEDILKEELNKLVGAAVTQLAEQYAQDLGLGGFGLASENPIDFVGVAQRFKEGGVKGVFAIDPVRVRLVTPVIDLDGFMSYTPKHPVYGDVWLGDIDMTIKVPKKFAFNAIYFNGRKDDVSYWFCQLTPPGDENTPYQLGKPLAKSAKPLKDPVNIGIAQIVGASGRLYHHMKESPGNGIVPDASMRYGAYMHFVFFDKQSDGQNLRLEVSGEINSSENGDYTIAFDGNLQTRSKAPKVLEIDTQAAVQGTVTVRYNSAEEHFLGYARVIVKTSSLCADASLLVDVKPGKWRVAIGTREERIVFVPGCAGWSPTGWLDVNQNEAELGLGIMYSGKAKSPDINIGIVEFNIEVDAGFAFGILAVIQYKPSFQLMRAGVWVDMWANIIANYKFPLKSWKKIVLVEIFIRGDLVIIFNPPPTMLEGKLNGKVKVLCFNMNFKAEMRKEI
jgi:CheY-specific phosphatase CheX